MAKRLKLGNIVLCEHAVPGAGNKHTLVGVYAGDILLDAPGPIAMGLFIEVLPETAPAEMTVTLQLNGRPVGRVMASYIDRTVDAPSLVVIPLVMVRVESDSVFEVLVEAEGYAKLVALTKKITLNPASKALSPASPTVLPPPSEQSPPASRRKVKLI